MRVPVCDIIVILYQQRDSKNATGTRRPVNLVVCQTPLSFWAWLWLLRPKTVRDDINIWDTAAVTAEVPRRGTEGDEGWEEMELLMCSTRSAGFHGLDAGRAALVWVVYMEETNAVIAAEARTDLSRIPVGRRDNEATVESWQGWANSDLAAKEWARTEGKTEESTIASLESKNAVVAGQALRTQITGEDSFVWFEAIAGRFWIFSEDAEAASIIAVKCIIVQQAGTWVETTLGYRQILKVMKRSWTKRK